MKFMPKDVFMLCAVLLLSLSAQAHADDNLCTELSGHFAPGKPPTLPNPSRMPTPLEQKHVDQAKLELLAGTDYAMGAFMVDADNDGKEDLFAWNIQGSGRFVYAEVYEVWSKKAGEAQDLRLKTSLDLGVLDTPRFIRFKGSNYIVSSETGDQEGTTVTQIVKNQDGNYQQRKICQMQTILKPDATCRHAACKELQSMIGDTSKNAPFVNVEWPHKYFSPAGLEVYFSSDWSQGDLDNSGKRSTVWRMGRDGYINQHIYWALLGEGDQPPLADPKLRPMSEDKTVRSVLPGQQHERLRRILQQQSATFSVQLHKPIDLPNMGQFFLFDATPNAKANSSKTYWAWDFGETPYGEDIHIVYTNANKSDYVGTVHVKRLQTLAPCKVKCLVESQR